jgi:hypothetical protein
MMGSMGDDPSPAAAYCKHLGKSKPAQRGNTRDRKLSPKMQAAGSSNSMGLDLPNSNLHKRSVEMSKQFAAPQSVRQSVRQSGRQIIAALVLAVALTSLPALATHLPGPLSNVFAQPAYACPVGGSCG